MLAFSGRRDPSFQLFLPCLGSHVLFPHESQLPESLVTVGGCAHSRLLKKRSTIKWEARILPQLLFFLGQPSPRPK